MSYSKRNIVDYVSTSPSSNSRYPRANIFDTDYPPNNQTNETDIFAPFEFINLESATIPNEKRDSGSDDMYSGDLAISCVEQQCTRNEFSNDLNFPKSFSFPNSGMLKNSSNQMNAPFKIRFYDDELQNFYLTSSQLPIGDASNDKSNRNYNELPTITNQEKRKLTRQYFVTVFSICYVILLVVLGTIIFIGDMMTSQYPLPQVFCIYMLVTAFSYFLFLLIDIRLHITRLKNRNKTRGKNYENYSKQMDRQFAGIDKYREFAMEISDSSESISHKYCFVNGKDGGSLYLKLGAAWFAFGLLTHSILQIGYQIFFLSSNGNGFYECASYINLVMDILFPMYSLFTLYFLVKYMNVVINANQNLARFCLIHAIGTSLTFWVFTIVRETAEAIARSDAEEYERTRVAEPNGSYTFVYHDCGKSNALNSINRQFTPYLYPFIIEYCILVVGIWYKIYENINRCPRNSTHSEPKLQYDVKSNWLKRSSTDPPESLVEHENDFEKSSYVYADCHSSFRGMIVGLLLLILTIVFVILLFIGVENEFYLVEIHSMTDAFNLCIIIIMIITTIIAYIRTSKLDILAKHHSSKLDNILLFIAIPAFFMESIFSLVPAIYYGLVLRGCISIANIIQVFIQTPFIVDGLRRCTNSAQLKKEKPGRELVIFLTIANISLWVFRTFSVKTADDGDERYEFYGFTLWNILNHVSLPLIMFYRFHSSVCLVEIWNYAYETPRKD